MHHISLNGTWRVSESGKRASLPATVPGCIHTDLLAADKIPDPFYRDNEKALQWIGERTWSYSRDFQVPAATLTHDRVLLRCEGLDTFAAARINGHEVGRADNMFRTWEFDAKPVLKPGRNRIEIIFDSVLPYIAKRQAERRLHDWVATPNEVVGRAWVRKQPCNFGWDWGPVLVTCGIWRDITIVAFDDARLIGLKISQEHADGRVSLHVTPELDWAGANRTAAVRIRILSDSADVPEMEGRPPCRPDARTGQSPSLHESTDSLVAEATVNCDSENGGAAPLSIPDPQLWWPNGLGAQPLYTITADRIDAANNVCDTLTRRVGLRTLQLDRHADAWGESFQFVVNGVPFFAKGGNWIPADAFVTRVTPADYARLINDVADANMNMLRVWGGGIYENDVFYDLCDERGICVWQDFMFACSTYPAFDAAFMTNVRAEAVDNVRRLRHHACIALWCGNNELEQGFVGDVWDEKHMSWADYGRLFEKLLPAVVQELSPGHDYWPGSPHSPHGDRKDHSNAKWGDAHLWEVWHGRKPFEWYRTCEHRFNSEFGFQSFPEPKTVHGYTAPQDRNVTTYVMEQHQRSGIGNAVIMQYMLDWFRLPQTFDHTLWLSQIQQGMAIKYACEHWRRSMPRGMGTLYWQINDCWPVASWSSIDSHGRWKALHYMARNFFAPVLVSAVEDIETGTVALHLTNDRREAVSGKVTWLATDVAGKPLAKGTQSVTAQPLANTPAGTISVAKQLKTLGPRGVIAWIDFSVSGVRQSTNLALFARPKHLELANAKIGSSVKSLKNGTYAVTLRAHAPALWTWLELDGIDARFSDNFIHLLPGRPETLIVTPAKSTTPARLKQALKASSLRDTYA